MNQKRVSPLDEDYTLFIENWKEMHSPEKQHHNNDDFFHKKRESLSFFNSKTYFLTGNDDRKLNDQQMLEMIDFVNQDQKGQSFLVYNSNELLRKINTWKEKLPWIRPFYAIKSNPTEFLVKDVYANGAGFDVASQGEIKRGLELGVNPHDMIFSNPVKEENDIEFAAKSGVLFTTADSFDELIKIKRIAPNMKILWRISIVEDQAQKLSTTFSNKFGDDITDFTEAQAKFHYIKSQLGITLHGIHFHCGSGKDGAATFLKAVETAKKCIEIAKKVGHEMELLDLGGGFPAGDLPDKLVELLHTTKDDPLGYKVVAEPGRHFSSQTCYLFTRVLAKRIKKGKMCFHVNESLYHSFNCILMDSVSFEGKNDQFYRIINNSSREITAMDNQHMEDGSIFGMTCDGLDVIAKSMNIPQDIQVHDWLCFGGFGSYTFGPKSNFNGMESTTRVFSWEGDVTDNK